MEEAVFSDDKQTREENIRVITEKLEEAFADNEEWLAVLGEAVYQYQKKTVRKMILKTTNVRTAVRSQKSVLWQQRLTLSRVFMVPLCSPVDRLRSATTTLAPLSEAQKLDGLDEFETSKRYMHQYNFRPTL